MDVEIVVTVVAVKVDVICTVDVEMLAWGLKKVTLTDTEGLSVQPYEV